MLIKNEDIYTMRWSHLFSSTIRNRGFLYYKNGHVEKVHKTGNTYTGTVTGSSSHIYRVTVTVKNDVVRSMSCTCPYAQGGIGCKHEAAVLYMIEQEPELIQDSGPAKPEKPDPPLDPLILDQLMASPGEYTYFHPEEMGKSLPITTSMWENALDFVREGKLKLSSMNTTFSGGYYYSQDDSLKLDITGSFPKSESSSQPEVRMTCDSTHILKCNCTYKGCNTHYDIGSRFGAKVPCIHGLGLYYLAGLKIKKEKPGDATDRIGQDFLSRFQFFNIQNKLLDIAEQLPGETLELEARLNDKYFDGLTVSFRIGTKSLYIIKDLTHFVDQMEKKAAAPFGTKTTLKLGEEYLTEQGKRYYAFIKKYITEQNRYNAYYRHSPGQSYYAEEIKQELPLFGQRIDDLYEAIGNHTIELSSYDSSKKKKEMLTCRDASLPLSLELSPVYTVAGYSAPLTDASENSLPFDEYFDGICVTGSLHETINGANASYYVAPPYFNRISKDRIKEIAPLAAMAYDGQLQFTIGRRNLSQFYYKTLP